MGQLTVAKDYQGQGHASSLLLFALKTAVQAAEIVGSMGVITHPLDDGERGFYARSGFQDLPFDSRPAMFVRIVDLQAVFAGSFCTNNIVLNQVISFYANGSCL